MATAILILTLCIPGGECRDERVPLEMSVIECNESAQIVMPIWMDIHPGLTVEKWHCAELGEHEL